MNLQVSVVLLFISLTGGYALKCYSCAPVTGSCAGTEQICTAADSACFKIETSTGSKVSGSSKGCTPVCKQGATEALGVTVTTSCCNTDLCNAADGVYKGSFLLLVSPLLFYFLFQ
ncbi:hypothetical protein R3I94_004944 [Phoxinus phoxinus]